MSGRSASLKFPHRFLLKRLPPKTQVPGGTRFRAFRNTDAGGQALANGVVSSTAHRQQNLPALMPSAPRSGCGVSAPTV